MSLYLIIHKVRGEPALDIAEKMEIGDEQGWIIPTSGHRAYPCHYWALDDLYDGSDMDMPMPTDVLDDVILPDDLPDHYAVRAAPTRLSGLLEKLGLKKDRPSLNVRPL
jgi:hypothetical protein